MQAPDNKGGGEAGFGFGLCCFGCWSGLILARGSIRYEILRKYIAVFRNLQCFQLECECKKVRIRVQNQTNDLPQSF